MLMHGNYDEENKLGYCYCYWNDIMFEPIMEFTF